MNNRNPLVYAVLVRNKSPFRGWHTTVYISSIFKKQEDAWSHIETLLYDYIEPIISNDIYNFKIISVEIKSSYVVLNYEDFVEDLYGTIIYEIDTLEVK